MIYNLGKYRYNKGKLYKQVFWFIFKCIDRGPYTYREGVQRVNRLAGVKEDMGS